MTSRRQALAYAALNQLAFPGMGTILAGRWVGYLQAPIMVAGFCLTMGFMICYFKAIAQFALDQTAAPETLRASYQPYLWALRWGLGLCAVAWVWSLASSIAILRERKRNQKSVTPPPLPKPLA